MSAPPLAGLCGAAAATVFEAAGITARPDTLEEDVKAALTKVQLGEVDAALVYATDVLAAGDEVEGIEFPEPEAAMAKYYATELAVDMARDAIQALGDRGTITIRTRREGSCAIVEVSDDGPGIPPAKGEDIFGMLTRLEPESGAVGSGIGLAVALPAVMGYNWLTRSNRVLTTKLDAFAFELLNFLLIGRTLQTAGRGGRPGTVPLAAVNY